MKMDEYLEKALRTAPNEEGEFPSVEYLAIGLAGEVGELLNMVKKSMRHGFSFDPDTMKDELGDCLWYLTVLSHALGHDLSSVAGGNIEKLRKRYPDGFLPRGKNE